MEGLSSSAVADSRAQSGWNVVRPPVDLPKWICCLLPCIKYIPSMVAYRACCAREAELKRGGCWGFYDSDEVVEGDIMRVGAGAVIAGDGEVLEIEGEVIVDGGAVDGSGVAPLVVGDKAWMGSTVLAGRFTARVSAVGSRSKMARLIKAGKFPLRTTVGESEVEDEKLLRP